MRKSKNGYHQLLRKWWKSNKKNEKAKSRNDDKEEISKNSKTEPEIKSKWNDDTGGKKKSEAYSEFK